MAAISKINSEEQINTLKIALNTQWKKNWIWKKKERKKERKKEKKKERKEFKTKDRNTDKIL